MGHAWHANLHGVTFPTGRYPVRLHTNLDLAAEVLPDWFATVPRVDDLVESETSHPLAPNFRLRLRVCSVVHVRGQVSIELTVPSHFPTLTEFYRRYERVTGRTFI